MKVEDFRQFYHISEMYQINGQELYYTIYCNTSYRIFR